MRDRATNEPCFQASEDDQVVNVSRRGVCLLSSQPPNVGTRLWLQIRLPDSPRALEVIGRACWTRVQFERGEQGARPICAVGVEVLGGSPAALDRYDRFVTELNAQELGSLAAPAALG